MLCNLRFVKRIQSIIVISLLISSTSFAQWSASVNLSPHAVAATLNENMGPCIAVSGDTVHVVWVDKRSSTASAIFYKRSIDAGLTWNTEVALTDSNGKASFPAIAVSGSSVHVVWMDSLGGVRVSDYKRSLDGGATWGAFAVIDSNSAFWPGVAASGNLVIVSLNLQDSIANTEVHCRRSLNNGTTWLAKQRLSHAAGRSEDPSMAIINNNVHLAWNDNRSGSMQIYYIHSSDQGATWGAETQVGPNSSYSTQVSQNGNNADVVYGNNATGNYDVFFRNSIDTGATWVSSASQLTTDLFHEAYPFLARDGNRLHLTYYQLSGMKSPYYMYSGDGGATWSTPLSMGNGGQPFVAYTGCVVHIIYPDSATQQIFYRRNPTANAGGCSTTFTENKPMVTSGLTLAVNPTIFNEQTKIEFSLPEDGNISMKIVDCYGRIIAIPLEGIYNAGTNYSVTFDASKLPSGIYLCRLTTQNSSETAKMVIRK